MDKEDIKILEDSGWDVVCLSPLEIKHRDSRTEATGFIAEMVLSMIKSNIVHF